MHGSCPPPVTRKPTGDKPANESRTQQQDDPRPQNIWGKGNKRSCSERHESNCTPKSNAFQRSIHGYLSTRDMDPLVQFPNKHNGILM